MPDKKPDMQRFKVPASSIEYVRGIGKNSGKPYRAIMLTVGEWSEMHFLESRFEMDYIEKLALTKSPEKVHSDPRITPDDKIDLTDDETNSDDWFGNK